MRKQRPPILSAVGIAALAAAVVIASLLAPLSLAQAPSAQSQTPATSRPSFDAASIKRSQSSEGRIMFRPQPGGRFTGTNVTLGGLINFAYELKAHQMVGGPAWINSEHFDIETKADGNPPIEQMRLMMQSLLAERFKLIAHQETRQLPVYALVLSKAGKTGPKLIEHSDDTKCLDISAGAPPPPPGAGTPTPPCGGFMAGPSHMSAQRITMEIFSKTLGDFVDRVVVNQTALNGVYDVDFDFTPLQSPLGPQRGPDANAPDPSAPPSIFTAIQEQLGLKLESQTGPLDVLVIDHVEEPSPN